jgi:hypothetical protein
MRSAIISHRRDAFCLPIKKQLANEDKLRLFQDYFNRQRVHSGLEGRLPEPGEAKVPLNFASYRWQQHCRGLFQTPIAA